MALSKHLIAALLLTVGLAGCEKAPQTNKDYCWRVTKAALRSPSTAKLIDSKNADLQAFLTLDAANAYGTPVRMRVVCDFADTTATAKVTSLTIDGEPLTQEALAEASAVAVSEQLAEMRRN